LRSDGGATARRVARVAALTVTIGCELDKIDLPVMPSVLVIHGALTRSATTQTVLVERTLTGEFAAPRVFPGEGLRPLNGVSADEPILSDGGIPERDATTELITPAGQTIVGREVSSLRLDGHGAGVYQFALSGASLVAGGRYQLRVTTRRGEVVTAETIVPVASAVLSGPTVNFDRARDTLAIAWPAVDQAESYQVRIETPFEPWTGFTDSTRISLTGTLRRLGGDDLGHVFIPGFRQVVTVSAIDANLRDYYRTSNNSFTGSGLISRVSGGLGVFGSLVTVSRRTVNVTAPIREPIEGTFNLTIGTLGYLYGGDAGAFGLTLYVESPATRADQLSAVSGAYRRSNGTFGGAVGTLSGTNLKLALLAGEFANDTLEVLTAELRGDTLSGTFRKGAPARYVRQ
jgi:hypothetical protein